VFSWCRLFLRPAATLRFGSHRLVDDRSLVVDRRHRPKTRLQRAVSAESKTQANTRLIDESAAEYTRRRAKTGRDRAGGPSPTTRFLQCVPPDTGIDELEELWPVYVDAVGGVDR
jgi:hypothetical protein